MDADKIQATIVSYEDLANIEDEFEEIDLEIMRKQYALSKPAFAKRTQAIAAIPNFWPLVLEQSPPEIDAFIQQEDSRIFGESLTGMQLTRPDLDADPEKGHPRSVKIRFEFKENEDFEDTVMEKTLWYRRSREGWAGLVSEPVKVHWKKGKDLTEGLTDAACALWEERVKKGDQTAKDVSGYEALKEKVEHWGGQNTSFFAWFGWVSSTRYVSAEESEIATKEMLERKEKRKAGEKVDFPSEEAVEAMEANDQSDVEVHPGGDDVAVCLAEDVWPNAIKYFTQAQEMDEMSDDEFEEADMEDLEDDDEDGEPIDIRSLVQGKGGSSGAKGRKVSGGEGPPGKKAKKST